MPLILYFLFEVIILDKAISDKILELLKFAYIENGDAHVTSAQVERFLDDNITMRYVKKRHHIVDVASNITAVNLVLTGSFSIIRQSRKGHNVSISKVTCPELVGCTQMFSDTKEFYSDIIATQDCCCIDIDHNVFYEATWQESRLSVIVIEHLCRILQSAHSRIDRIVGHESIDNLIIFLYHRWLERGRDVELFKYSDNYNLIAMELGVSTRTLYRSVGKLRERGFLTVEKGGALLMTREQIKRIYNAYTDLMLSDEQTLNIALDTDRFKTKELRKRLL